MADFTSLQSALSLRRMPKGGPNRSGDINDSFDEFIHDIAEVYNFINRTAIPIFNGLGRPGTYDIDAVANGLDGQTMLTNKDWSDSTSPYFFSSSKSRPKSIHESFMQVVNDLGSIFDSVNKINTRLGSVDINVDANPATLSELENSVNHFIGIARNLQVSIDGFLTASGIAAGIANNTIDPSTFNIVDSDISALAAVGPAKISGVDLTVNFDYTTGLPANYDMADTVQRVKEFVEDVSGDSIITFAGSGLTGDSLKTHREKVGTGTTSSTNPHGQDIGDFNDSNALLAQPQMVADFAFQLSGFQDASPVEVYQGGYVYVDRAYTVTRVAGTATYGGVAGVTATIYRRRSAANVIIYTPISIPATTPALFNATAGFTTTDLEAGDLVFISGITGDGKNARVHLWATPNN